MLGLLAQVLLSLAAVLLLCLFLRSHVIGHYCKRLHAESKGTKEILLLGITAFVFFMLTVCSSNLSILRFLNLKSLSKYEVFFNFVGNRVSGCFNGAGLLLGWSSAVLTGTHGHIRGHGVHRTS